MWSSADELCDECLCLVDFLVAFFVVVSSVALVSLDEPLDALEPVAPCVFDSDDLPADLSNVELESLRVGALLPVEPLRLVVAALDAPLPVVPVVPAVPLVAP